MLVSPSSHQGMYQPWQHSVASDSEGARCNLDVESVVWSGTAVRGFYCGVSPDPLLKFVQIDCRFFLRELVGVRGWCRLLQFGC